MASFKPRKVPGRWRDGYAPDLHTISIEFLGHDEYGHPRFENTRSEIGELLHKLKYRQDKSVLGELVNALVEFMNSWSPGVDALVPVPASSTTRAIQPVQIVGEALSRVLNIPFVDCVTVTRMSQQLKNVHDYDERLRLLAGLHDIDASAVRKKRVLLFDDLYRSGATMNAIANNLYGSCGVIEVFALTITKTRSNQ